MTPVGWMESSLDAVARVLDRISRAQLVSSFGKSDASRLVSTLSSGASRGTLKDAESVISHMDKVLSQHHPMLRLLVQASCVKALSKDAWNDDLEEETVEMTSSDDDEEEQPGPSKTGNPLVGKSPTDIADFLLTELNEVAAVRTKFITIATRLGAEGVWQVLQEVVQHADSQTDLTKTADGQRKRTLGGVFLKLAKQREVELATRSTGPSVADLTLRDYQQRCVDVISDKGGNWVVAAPTNTGKTAIFIEMTKRLLKSKPQGTVVVLVPTVSLVRQQSIAYEKAGFRPASEPSNAPLTALTVDWFCGDKPLSPSSWQREVSRLNVMVIEAQSFCNVLDKGKASLADVDMLVLDECHHTAKEHPYARVMQFFSSLPESNRPQVLGFSASPGKGKSQAQVEQDLARLLGLLAARLHVISEDDPHVRQVAPGPEQEEKMVDVRPVDGHVQEWIRHTMHVYAIAVDADLDRRLCSPGVPAASRQAAQMQLGRVPSTLEVTRHATHAYNVLCGWMNQAANLAKSWRLVQLARCLQLLEVLRRAEALCADMGYECALQFIARHIINLAVACTLDASEDMVVTSPHKPNRSTASGPSRSVSTVASDRTLDVLRNHVARAPLPSVIATSVLALDPFSGLVACEDVEVDARQLGQRFVRDLSAWEQDVLGGHAIASDGDDDDYETPQATEWCQQLVEKSVSTVLPGGLSPDGPPKVWEVIQYLTRYRSQSTFHGIIFCRSRQGARYLVELLRAARLPTSSAAGPLKAAKHGKTSSPRNAAQGTRPVLDFVDDVSLFVGHGSLQDTKGKGVGPAGAGTSHVMSVPGESLGLSTTGMSVKQQQTVLEEFKLPGRKLLIATNAAEEGLDLPCCEFVVRFSPPATGIQSVQGRGRARKLGAHYICLLQSQVLGSLKHRGNDLALHNKSRDEEHVLRSVLANVASKQRLS